MADSAGRREEPVLLGSAEVRELTSQLGLRPSKQRGQNFVVDANTIRRIVRVARLEPHDTVLEVGPGLGSLTLGLLGAARHVTAVEADAVLAEALPRTIARFAPTDVDRLTVRTADALRLDTWAAASDPLVGDPGVGDPRVDRDAGAEDATPTVLVANLPYNVAVPVLLTVLEHVPSVRRGIVMVQLEVAERLAAEPGSKEYGVPSVKMAWYATVERAGSVSSHVFWPRPHVDSGLVVFHRHSAPADTRVSRTAVFAVIDAAFAQRRKTLRAALARLAGSTERSEAILHQAGIDPRLRGERLELAEFRRIAEVLPTDIETRGSLSE